MSGRTRKFVRLFNARGRSGSYEEDQPKEQQAAQQDTIRLGIFAILQ